MAAIALPLAELGDGAEYNANAFRECSPPMAAVTCAVAAAVPLAVKVAPFPGSAGTAAPAVARAADAAPPPTLRASAWKRVEVRAGDTAWDISLKFGLSLEELGKLNGDVELDSLYPGDVLRLPPDATERHPAFVSLRSVKARVKGAATNAHFFDVFPPPKDIDEYRAQHRVLLNSMRLVESSFMLPAPVGDDGLSIGPLQISDDYHTDAWWLAKDLRRYEHCEHVEYAERTVVNYWLRYCPWAVEFGDAETLARIHNGGPRFWRHIKTASYWRKVKSAMKHFGHHKGIPELDPRLSIGHLSSNGNFPVLQGYFALELPTRALWNPTTTWQPGASDDDAASTRKLGRPDQ